MAWHRWVILAVLAFIGAIIVLALTTRSWSGQLATPTGAKTEKVTFTCGAVWGADTVKGPKTTAYPVVGTPCGTREQDRVMSGIDVAAGGAALVLVVWLWRRSAGDRDRELA